jgi:FMN phosphatase YigB (HAD superfamily)
MLAFANHFKIDAIVKDHLDRTKVFGKKDDHTRKTLQIRGTEEGRDKYGENIWINLLYEWLLYYQDLGYTRAIIFDCRFPNEVDFINQIGGKIIRIESGQRSLDQAQREADENGIPVEAITQHRSETSLDEHYDFYAVVNNDYHDNPFEDVKKIVRIIECDNMPDMVFFVDVDDTLCYSTEVYKAKIDQVKRLLVDLAIMENVPLEKLETKFDEAYNDLKFNHHHISFEYYGFAEEMEQAIIDAMTSCGIIPESHQDLIMDAYETGLSVYVENYEPIPGAVETIKKLARLGKVVFMTHGDRVEQVKKIAYLGLSQYDAFVTRDKNRHSYETARMMYPAYQYIMIGDNFKRDISEAHAGGIETLFWVNSKSEFSLGSKNTDQFDDYHEVQHISEALDIIYNKILDSTFVNLD